jgi:xylan 1,4-beta-xylosidase
VLSHYAAMGSPEDPTPEQVEQLNRESALPAPQQTTLRDGKLSLTLTPNALLLIKVQR